MVYITWTYYPDEPSWLDRRKLRVKYNADTHNTVASSQPYILGWTAILLVLALLFQNTGIFPFSEVNYKVQESDMIHFSQIFRHASNVLSEWKPQTISMLSLFKEASKSKLAPNYNKTGKAINPKPVSSLSPFFRHYIFVIVLTSCV